MSTAAIPYIAEDGRVDGSWELTITVTDLQVEKTLRVKGDLHIGGVMVKLVEALEIEIDWSDHALWWPKNKMWLSRPRSTLDQYGVQADAQLEFTPMHKNLRVQLPDLQILDLRVNFSMNVFGALIQITKELGIRHSEELSMMKRYDKDDLKKYIKDLNQQKKKKKDREHLDPSVNGNGIPHSPSNSLGRTSPFPSRSPMGPSPSNTLTRLSGNMSQGSPTTGNTLSPYNTFNGSLPLNTPGSLSMYSLSFEGFTETALANSPVVSSKDAFQHLYRPKNFVEKARINYAWMDSSRSLMEQGVHENECVLLKFKFFKFYDLNPKYDAVRINQLYEQAKWSLMAEELDCTEEEMMMFAALQVQVQLQAGLPQGTDMVDHRRVDGEDDIDAALKDLQESLEGSSVSSPGDITYIPELGDYLRFMKPKKMTLKSFKRAWCTFKDTHMAFYRSKEDSTKPPTLRINIRGCEIHPDTNLSTRKYGIKLSVPDEEGMCEYWLRFDSEEQYCKWMAACKLAAKGKTMADSSYDNEVKSLQTFLNMQHPSTQPVVTPHDLNIEAEDFISPRFFKKVKAKQLVHRILENHTKVKDLSLIEAKMQYIKAFQELPDFGITYFVVRMQNGKKDELMAVANNRIIRMDLHSGDSLKTWRFSTLKSWHVNWGIKHVILDFEEEKVVFQPISADCKVLHEFIGGYIFLSMRSQDKNQSLNEELFHKLTGGKT